MMERVRDWCELAAMLAVNAPVDQIDKSFDAKEWLLDTRNIALRIDGDVAMFEYFGEGVCQGHVWFASRGRQAIERGQAMLAEMFDRYGAVEIIGETPLTRPDAWLFVRRLGFERTGYATRPQGTVITSRLYRNLPALKSVA